MARSYISGVETPWTTLASWDRIDDEFGEDPDEHRAARMLYRFTGHEPHLWDTAGRQTGRKLERHVGIREVIPVVFAELVGLMRPQRTHSVTPARKFTEQGLRRRRRILCADGGGEDWTWVTSIRHDSLRASESGRRYRRPE